MTVMKQPQHDFMVGVTATGGRVTAFGSVRTLALKVPRVQPPV